MGDEGRRKAEKKWVAQSLKLGKQPAKLRDFSSNLLKSDSINLDTDPCSYQDLSRFWIVFWALSEILFLIVFHTEPHEGINAVCQLLFVSPHLGHIGLHFLISGGWVGLWASFVLCTLCYFGAEPFIVCAKTSRAFFYCRWQLSTSRWWLFCLLDFWMIAMKRDPLTTCDRHVTCKSLSTHSWPMGLHHAWKINLYCFKPLGFGSFGYCNIPQPILIDSAPKIFNQEK